MKEQFTTSEGGDREFEEEIEVRARRVRETEIPKIGQIREWPHIIKRSSGTVSVFWQQK